MFSPAGAASRGSRRGTGSLSDNFDEDFDEFEDEFSNSRRGHQKGDRYSGRNTRGRETDRQAGKRESNSTPRGKKEPSLFDEDDDFFSELDNLDDEAVSSRGVRSKQSTQQEMKPSKRVPSASNYFDMDDDDDEGELMSLDEDDDDSDDFNDKKAVVFDMDEYQKQTKMPSSREEYAAQLRGNRQSSGRQNTPSAKGGRKGSGKAQDMNLEDFIFDKSNDIEDEGGKGFSGGGKGLDDEDSFWSSRGPRNNTRGSSKTPQRGKTNDWLDDDVDDSEEDFFSSRSTRSGGKKPDSGPKKNRSSFLDDVGEDEFDFAADEPPQQKGRRRSSKGSFFDDLDDFEDQFARNTDEESSRQKGDTRRSKGSFFDDPDDSETKPRRNIRQTGRSSQGQRGDTQPSNNPDSWGNLDGEQVNGDSKGRRPRRQGETPFRGQARRTSEERRSRQDDLFDVDDDSSQIRSDEDFWSSRPRQSNAPSKRPPRTPPRTDRSSKSAPKDTFWDDIDTASQGGAGESSNRDRTTPNRGSSRRQDASGGRSRQNTPTLDDVDDDLFRDIFDNGGSGDGDSQRGNTRRTGSQNTGRSGPKAKPSSLDEDDDDWFNAFLNDDNDGVKDSKQTKRDKSTSDDDFIDSFFK
eukprot:Plantae.Rhodophyta-Purpureofilum_apyrenoidigerum.ctg9.p1 GENE.Plantae.Rhodophyta-Purpureofilum_apyrenoidigerum.ctg9~~Plantae.Rhodophyta-Purpureofilum_apyrenoidigerum.ctg9.p1  ORF type:complete len:631 (+),score=127.06 Plantae.Rhodophyta-Purpureofilum_apyrenoidigerum.ctg9:1988-3880(+)